MMRPAGTKPRFCASRKAAVQRARSAGFSAWASARDPFAQLVGRLLAALGVFLNEDFAGDVLYGEVGGGAHGSLEYWMKIQSTPVARAAAPKAGEVASRAGMPP
jgi:hypothetical protein